MNFRTAEQAKEYIKDMPIEDYLDGVAEMKGKKYVCPLCSSGTGAKGTAGTSIKDNKFSCFSCGEMALDTFDLIAKIEGVATSEAFKIAFKHFDIHIDKEAEPIPTIVHEKVKELDGILDTKEAADLIADRQIFFFQAHRKLLESTTALEYLANRGISKETAQRFNLGYVKDWVHPSIKKYPTQRIIIPTGTTDYTARAVDSTIAAQYKAMKVGSSGIYNTKAIEADTIFIVEGEFDALSVEQMGHRAVALGSVANKNKLIDFLLSRDNLSEKSFVLALDNDAAGNKATMDLQELFSEHGIKHIVHNIAGNYKDANDLLVKDSAQLKRNLEGAEVALLEQVDQEQAEYVKGSTAFHLENFLADLQANTDIPYLPTGFGALDKVLDGGLYPGLYIIGASSSLGKTTFTIQMADQIAEQGTDVLIFSLEMARTELMAKSISRHTFQHSKAHAKTARDISTSARYKDYTEQERALIEKSCNTYKSYAKNIYIHEGVGNIGIAEIKQVVDKHIKVTGKTPLVIIDYLQILAPHDPRLSDKQNTDIAVLELKRMSRDYKLAVFGISSLNRNSYAEAVTMASYKESGSIEYSSDVLLGLDLRGVGAKDFDVDAAKAKDIRDIELKILKNRNGQTGSKLYYNFHSKYNCFEEQQDLAAELLNAGSFGRVKK